MAPSLFKTAASALVALSSISRVLAFDDISIQDSVAAGADAQVTITNDISSGSGSFDAGFSNYRVYLSVSPPGWGSNPCCYLVNSSAIDVTDFTVQIPASVGPSASNYSLVTMEFNNDPNLDGPSGFEYSNDFTLTGGTGVWSAYETDPSGPYGLGDPDSIPCSAYECARNCNQKYYPANIGEDDMTAYKNTYECVAACPGVTYASWDSLDSGDGGDDSSASSTSAGAASSTATQTSTTTASTKSQSILTSATSSTSIPSSTSKSASTSGSSTASPSTSSQTSSGAVSDASIPRFALLVTFLVGSLAVAKL